MLYYVITAVVGVTESAESATAGPITIGEPAGGSSVSGTVTFPGTATGPLYVVLENEAAAAAIVAEADETVIQRFYLLRPELAIDLEDLIFIEFDDPLPVVPSG